jgi:hypothetical protein
MDLSNNLH